MTVGITSRMVVGSKSTGDPTVTQVKRSKFTLAKRLDRALWRLQYSPVETWRSPARFGCITAEEINRTDADIVNLHWVNDGLLSIEEIARIRKPIAWSMYDMWLFTGTEHYCSISEGARWRNGYSRVNRPREQSGLDLDYWTYKRKLRKWSHKDLAMHLVPASSWLEQVSGESALMDKRPQTRIPHVIDTDRFAPIDRLEARRRMGLSSRGPIILFLSSAGPADRRKGFDLLERALPDVLSTFPDAEMAVAGPIPSRFKLKSNIETHWLGSLHGDKELRLAYCAADVLVVPSREDNMPLSAMEAQACGRPVVSFDVGGLPDIVQHRKTGYLSHQFRPESLAEGLVAAISRSEDWGAKARFHAVDHWANQVVAKQYIKLYAELTQ